MAALQSDSFYVPKQWDQVRGREALGGFTEDPTDARARSSAEAEAAGKQAKKRMKWLPLLPQAWHELPWQSGMPTTLRDIDRNLQVELATDAGNMRRMLAANRKLLEVYFPGMITPRTEKFSYMVLHGDQAVRWSWFCWSLGFFLVLGLILDLNATSWHGFYADQIAGA